MKVASSTKFMLMLFSFQAIACYSFGQTWPSVQAWIPAYNQAKQVQQNNEFSKNTVDGSSEFFCNPVLLDGKMLDYNKFSLESRGKLSIVMGNPKDSTATKIPFTIMIRRDGKIVTSIRVSEEELYEIELSKVLATAKSGDQLIVDPINPKDWKGKRILKIIENNC